jgi:hypothetical protein
LSKKWTGNRTRERVLRRLIRTEVAGTPLGVSPSPSTSDVPFASLLNSGILVAPSRGAPPVDPALAAMWRESPREIVIRWYRRQSPESQAAMVGPDEALERGIKRASVVLRQTGLGPTPPMATPRDWIVKWRPALQVERIVNTLARWGHTVVRVPSLDDAEAMARAERNAPEATSLIALDHSVVDRWLQYLRGASSPYEFDVPTIEALTLAHELYAATCERLGSEAQPWVEQLGCAEFQRVLLGLPFSPLLLGLLPGHK